METMVIMPTELAAYNAAIVRAKKDYYIAQDEAENVMEKAIADAERVCSLTALATRRAYNDAVKAANNAYRGGQV